MGKTQEYKWKVRFFIGAIFLTGVVFIIGSIYCQETNIWNKILLSVGSSLIGGVLLVVITEYFFKKDIPNAITKEIVDNFFNNRNEILTSIIAIHNRLPDMRPYIRECKDCIDILTTKFSSIDRDEKDEIISVFKNNPNLRVRLLAITPENYFVNNYPIANGHIQPPNRYYNDCITSLASYLNMKNALNSQGVNTSNMDIRCYECSPTIRIFRFDNKMIIGFLWKHGRSNMLYHIELNTQSQLSQCFQAHFNDLFSSSIELTLEEIEKYKGKNRKKATPKNYN